MHLCVLWCRFETCSNTRSILRDTMDRAERDTDDLSSGGAGVQYLTPTKAFSKKRVTAGAAVVGAVHSSLEASMGSSKGDVIHDSWTQEEVSNVEVQESIGS